ncbi:hypothetical protein [Sulfurimonas sp.]|uniref:hypothetical protein n=1 Tax=Sulfurimonas sp. TaxID=2022749 RepID=UPI00261D9D8D|nr:hypothetical protein [Sulfurimonas sp.]MDD5157484.1 hypothetical protein [Sulfurimonas sp.]
MKKTYYESLYVVDIDVLEGNEEIAEGFVFQGSKNWDLYFLEAIPILEPELLKNVSLWEFDEKSEFKNNLQNNHIIDYSIEHVHELNKYFILVANGKD